MITKIGFWMLLLAFGVAFQMYYKNRAFGMDQNGDEYNNEGKYHNQSPGSARPEIRDDPVVYHLFNSLQNRDNVRLRMNYRPKFSMVDPLVGYGHVPYSELVAKVAKRQSFSTGSVPVSGNTDGHKLKPVDQKQFELKNKNDQKRWFWVYYFKLCACRPSD